MSLRCINRCGNSVRHKGYCPDCKALRKLLTALHGDDEHRGPRRSDGEEAERRRQIHRQRVSSCPDSRSHMR
jgi:hypothetical protein